MAKRVTPLDEESRIAERIYQEEGILTDERQFKMGFSKLLQISQPELTSRQKSLQDKAFDKYVSRHGLEGTKEEKKLFRKAKGKNLSRDRRTTSRRVVRTKKEFIKKGARNVDLTGFDTKGKEKAKVTEVPSIVKGRVVYTRRFSVVVKQKQRIVYRDSKGRFASHRK